jgi:hypothetical protein
MNLEFVILTMTKEKVRGYHRFPCSFAFSFHQAIKKDHKMKKKEEKKISSPLAISA